MFLIERIWIDTLENRDAYGFKAIGVVATREEADRICGLESIRKSNYPWPLKYANEFQGDTVPRFKATELRSLDGLGLEQLNASNVL